MMPPGSIRWDSSGAWTLGERRAPLLVGGVTTRAGAAGAAPVLLSDRAVVPAVA